jgi:hypothetical protein
MLDREHFAGATAEDPPQPGETTSGQDNVNVAMLDWAPSDSWGLDLTYLDSGLCEESGWSLGVEAEVLGLDFYGEYSQLLDWQSGEDYSVYTGTQILDLDESDTAWMGGLRWSSPAVCITGEYGEVDPGYALSFAMYGGPDNFGLPLSLLHPNAEVDPHDINWIDRPLFLDPTNIARGWHVGVMFPSLLGEGTPLSISYADGDSYCPDYLGWLVDGGPTSPMARPDPWRDADAVWSVKIERQLSEGVSANVIYGQRETENVMAAGDSCADDVKVVRAEVNVAF